MPNLPEFKPTSNPINPARTAVLLDRLTVALNAHDGEEAVEVMKLMPDASGRAWADELLAHLIACGMLRALAHQ